VQDDGPHLQDPPCNWNRYVGTPKLLRRGLQLVLIHLDPRDLHRIETDVEKERVGQNLFWTSEGEEEEAYQAKRSDDRRDQENGDGRKGRQGLQFWYSNA
jgi:hypothetical protein